MPITSLLQHLVCTGWLSSQPAFGRAGDADRFRGVMGASLRRVPSPATRAMYFLAWCLLMYVHRTWQRAWPSRVACHQSPCGIPRAAAQLPTSTCMSCNTWGDATNRVVAGCDIVWPATVLPMHSACSARCMRCSIIIINWTAWLNACVLHVLLHRTWLATYQNRHSTLP